MRRHPELFFALLLALLLPACHAVITDAVKVPVTITRVSAPGVDLAVFKTYHFAVGAGQSSPAAEQLRRLWAGWLTQRGLLQDPQHGQLVVEFQAGLGPVPGAPSLTGKHVRVSISRPLATSGVLDLLWQGSASCQSTRPDLLAEGQMLLRELAGEFPFASGKPMDRWVVLR